MGMLRKYSGLIENGPHSLMYMNTWSAVPGTVWEELGSRALLEEVWPSGGPWHFKSPSYPQLVFFFSALCLWMRYKL